MEAQLSFFNDMSKSLFRTVQQYSDLNINWRKPCWKKAPRRASKSSLRTVHRSAGRRRIPCPTGR
jgi:hypothetical protein